MQEREVKKKFLEVSDFINNNSHAQQLIQNQEQLETTFMKISQLIADYSVKKQENQKQYMAQVERLLNSLVEATSQNIGTIQNMQQNRGESWAIVNKKMEIFSMLRMNIKQMFNFTHGKAKR